MSARTGRVSTTLGRQALRQCRIRHASCRVASEPMLFSSATSAAQSRPRVAHGQVSPGPLPKDIRIPDASRPTWGIPGHADHDGKGPPDQMYTVLGGLAPAGKPLVSEEELRAGANLPSDSVLAHMRRSCKLAANILAKTRVLAETPGTRTEEIDILVRKLCEEAGAYPSPLNYRGFPKTVCTSVNDVMCHGIPDSTVLKEGDVINVDVSVFKDGFHGDTSRTFVVGGEVNADSATQALLAASRDGLAQAIKTAVRPGAPFARIGEVIQYLVESRGFTVARDFAGHGIGRHFHQPPIIVHVGNHSSGNMVPGQVFTIEPLVVAGSEGYDVWSDGWTMVSHDGSWSAQFEHTVLVTLDGCEVLTIPDEE